ncbi:MAG: DUF4258 domain-containing protein [Anaerolineae bacterium]|nr:DUF4258 domain-containing protein [Anaerolineae bacterium]
MYFTDLEDLLTYFRYMRLSDHALREANKESLHARDVFHAIFNGKILEHYCDRKRVLVVGPSARFDIEIHIVCDYADTEELVAVTVYVPDRPIWINELVRSPSTSASQSNCG